jgi:hypothetical protein
MLPPGLGNTVGLSSIIGSLWPINPYGCIIVPIGYSRLEYQIVKLTGPGGGGFDAIIYIIIDIIV